jgi:hypothetical protein
VEDFVQSLTVNVRRIGIRREMMSNTTGNWHPHDPKKLGPIVIQPPLALKSFFLF